MNRNAFVLLLLLGAHAHAEEDPHPTTYRMYTAFKAAMNAPPASYRARRTVGIRVDSLEPLRVLLRGSWLDPNSGQPVGVSLRHDAARAAEIRRQLVEEPARHGRLLLCGNRLLWKSWIATGPTEQLIAWLERDDAALLNRLQVLAEVGPTMPAKGAFESVVRLTVPSDAMAVKSQVIRKGLAVEWHRRWIDADEARRHAVVAFVLKSDNRRSLSAPFRLVAGGFPEGPTIQNGRGWRCVLSGRLIEKRDAAPFFRVLKDLNRELFRTQPGWCYEHVPHEYESKLRRDAFDRWLHSASLKPEQTDRGQEGGSISIGWMPKGVERRRADRTVRDGYERTKKKYAGNTQGLVLVLKKWRREGWSYWLFGKTGSGQIVAHHDAGFTIHATWHSKSTLARARNQVDALIGKQPEAGAPFWGD